MTDALDAGAACEVCGFELWLPVAALSVADVGLYDDERFPGRLIVRLRNHETDLGELDPDLLSRFMADVTYGMRRLRAAFDDVERVNVAILGNDTPHVHAHLIPRRPAQEPNPRRSPWNDPRSPGPMPVEQRTLVLKELDRAFWTTARSSGRAGVMAGLH